MDMDVAMKFTLNFFILPYSVCVYVCVCVCVLHMVLSVYILMIVVDWMTVTDHHLLAGLM